MYQHILVPIDGSETSMRGLDEAVKLARLCGATLRLVHVIDDLSFVTGYESGAVYSRELLPAMREAGQALLEQARLRAMSAGCTQVDTSLCEMSMRRTHEVILDEAAKWPADLIVLGTHGRRGVSRLMLGSDAEQTLRLSPIPVLLVRNPSRAAH